MDREAPQTRAEKKKKQEKTVYSQKRIRQVEALLEQTKNKVEITTGHDDMNKNEENGATFR